MKRFYKTILGVTGLSMCLSSGIFAMGSGEGNENENRQIAKATSPGLIERLERDQGAMNMRGFSTWAAGLDSLRISDPTLFLEYPYVGEAFEAFVRMAATNINIFPALTFEGGDNSAVNMGMLQSALCVRSGASSVDYERIPFTPAEINQVLSNNPIMNTVGITINPNALIGWKIWFLHNAEGFMRAAELAVVRAINVSGDQGAVIDATLQERIRQARRANTQLMRCVSSHISDFMYNFLSRMGQLPQAQVGAMEQVAPASALVPATSLYPTDPDLLPFDGDFIGLLNTLPLAQMREIIDSARGNTPPARPQLPQ